MSKISMAAGGFQKWFAVTVSSTEPDTHAEGSKFNQLINHPDWDCDNIDVKVVLNGIEFSNLDEIFQRVDEHIQKEAEELAGIDKNNQIKMDKIQEILNGYWEE